MSKQSTSFWDFSNQLYDREGIATVCLRLQDEYRLDVNLLLFSCWVAHFKEEPTEAAWQEILEFSTEWKSQVVQPLRSARKWMKQESAPNSNQTQFSVLRDRIKMDELAAEKIQQEFIEKCVEGIRGTASTFSPKRANSNFLRLLKRNNIENNEEISAQLQLLLNAVNDSSEGQKD